MSGDVEVYLDVMPGETRGVVLRGGYAEHLLIQRESDIPQYRLGASSVGRVVQVEAGLRAAFVDLGGPPPLAFLSLRKADVVTVGQKIEVVVVAEPRDRKGAALRLVGTGDGEPRLVEAGPTVEAELARLAPGANIQTGLAAVRAALDAEEEALASGFTVANAGLDLAVERTRALVAVDIDWTGAGGGKARTRVNALGLSHAARLIRLKCWGGLVAVDLLGIGQDAAAITDESRRAFGDDPDIVYGPVNRFGVLSLSLPWRRAPLEEAVADSLETRALAVVRRLRHNMLSDTTVARFRARCATDEARRASEWVARLGPRAVVVSDTGMRPGRAEIEEG